MGHCNKKKRERAKRLAIRKLLITNQDCSARAGSGWKVETWVTWLANRWIYSHRPGCPDHSQLWAGCAQPQCGLCRQPDAGGSCHTVDAKHTVQPWGHPTLTNISHMRTKHTAAVSHTKSQSSRSSLLHKTDVVMTGRLTENNLLRRTIHLRNDST